MGLKKRGRKSDAWLHIAAVNILPAFPRSPSPVFYHKEEKENEILTLYRKGTGTTVANAAIENRQPTYQKSSSHRKKTR